MAAAAMQKMTVFILLLVLLSVCQSFATVSSVKKSSDDLVEKVCKTTVDPRLCVSTLRSNPRSSSADVKGLGHIMLEASLAKGLDNFAQVKKLLATTKDPDIKSRLEACAFQYDLLIDSLKGAIQELESNSFDSAMNDASSAADGAETCEDAFTEKPNARPSPLTDRNTLLKHLAQISDQIINQHA